MQQVFPDPRNLQAVAVLPPLRLAVDLALVHQLALQPAVPSAVHSVLAPLAEDYLAQDQPLQEHSVDLELVDPLVNQVLEVSVFSAPLCMDQ